jgi:hypothetical protein
MEIPGLSLACLPLTRCDGSPRLEGDTLRHLGLKTRDHASGALLASGSLAVSKLVLCCFALLLLPRQAIAEVCPIDQVVFRDEQSGKEFAAERVALNYLYDCQGQFVAATRERPDLRDCRGPYGDTIIEGFMGGEKVFALYSVIRGAPCCTWESYLGTNTVILKKVKSWLPTGTGPKIDLSNKHDREWNTIADNSPQKVGGPLGGASFVPVACRSP